MIFLNKSKRRFLVCACISILASAKTYGMESKPVDSEYSESTPVDKNLSSMEADRKEEDEEKNEKPEDEKFSELQGNLNWYDNNSHQFNVAAHKVIAQEGGYKNMGECLFGYDDTDKTNKDEIKNYIEEDDLYRHIMFEIDNIRTEYKDKDYEKEGGWAAIGANPSFYSKDKDNEEIDVDKYHEGEVRAPIDKQKDFTNTFRTIGLYIRNYVYYLSYMKLFKNGQYLAGEDADILKHYVQRIIDDNDSYKTAYTKKYLFDRIGEILSNGIFNKGNSILNPEDVKKLEELAEGIKNKHEPLDEGEEGTSVPISKDYNDEDKLNSINENIENDIDNSYFKIIEDEHLLETMFSGQLVYAVRELLSMLGMRYPVEDGTVYDRYERPVGDKVDKKGTIITALTDCIQKIKACMKKNNQISGNFIPAILESIGETDNKKLEELIYKCSTIQNEINAFHSLFSLNSGYIVDPENVIAVEGNANTFGRTNIPAMDIVPAEKLSIPTLIKDITLNTRNLRDLLKLEFDDDNIKNIIQQSVLNSKNILTDFGPATQDNPKFVCFDPDETEATEEVLKGNPFANMKTIGPISQQNLVEKIIASVKAMSSISGRQYLILKKICQSLNHDLKIVIWDGKDTTSVFSDEGEKSLLEENILDNDIIETISESEIREFNVTPDRTVEQVVYPAKFVVYPTEYSIKTISQLKEFKQLGKKIGTKLLLEVFENSPNLTETNPDLCANILLMINLQDISEEFLPYKDYEKHFYNPYNEFFTDADKSLDALYQHNDGILARVEHGYIYDSDSRKFIEAELNNESLKQFTKQLFEEKKSIEQANEVLTGQVETLKKKIIFNEYDIVELKNKILELENEIQSLKPKVEKPEKKDFEPEAK